MLNTLHLLTLIKTPGVRNVEIRELLNSHFNAPSSIEELSQLTNNWIKERKKLKELDFHDIYNAYKLALNEMDLCQELGIHVIGINEQHYPQRLKTISKPPILIYVKGNLECLNEDLSVAIIGTRSPSDYGRICGRIFGERFTKQNFIVISGLAKGIDTEAHKGCISNNGKTIAVLAQGLNTPIYPKENRSLAEEILLTGGCLISEYGLGVRSRPNYFVERNRIQSGLSSGVVIVETAIKGGTMYTANFCIEQNKPLGCLNHPEKYLINNENALGNQFLIESQKAVPLFSEEEFNKFILRMKLPANYTSSEDNSLKKIIKTDGEGNTEQLSFFES